MLRQNILRQWQKTYREYPRQFWVLMFSSFIDRVGGSMLFPFFTVFIADQYDVKLTTIAYIFVLMGALGFIASIMGGNISDRLGRKPVVLVGLGMSALAGLGIGFSPNIGVMVVFAGLAGFFNNFGGPAVGAMVGDILPEGKRTSGFAIMRIVVNMAIVVGPILGGLIATRSFLALFILDALTSGITLLLLALYLSETFVPTSKVKSQEKHYGFIGTIKSYRVVLADQILLIFIVLATFTNIIYSQMYQTLPYFMFEIEKMPAAYYSYILSMNALMVVVGQYWVTQRTRQLSPLAAMALGSGFFGIGFVMYGIFSGFLLFAVAMVIITLGEMLYFPTAQAFITNLSPEDSRGRYMAAYEFAGAVSHTSGMLIAGVFIDSSTPDSLWWFCGILSMLTMLAYWQLRHLRAERKILVTVGATVGD
ncbi:MAG: MFS transporter [Chloroflexi bacterium]|nr:MAG: MFS transporter [Chloroflexota bacterium]